MEPPDRVRNVGHQMRVDSITAEVVARLDAAGIRAIVLKGPSFARWLYDDPSERLYSDTDLLVPPARADDVARELRSLGFEVAIPRHELDRPVPAVNWIRRKGGAAVDVHLGLTGATVPHLEQWEVLSRGTERMEVAGQEVEVLGPAGRALHVALHLAQHGGELRPLRDAERAVERVPLETWREAKELARRLGALPALSGGLRLADGAGIADELGLPAERSVEVILRETGDPLALGLKWLGEMPGVRARVKLVWAKAFPPAHEMVPDPRRRSAGSLAAAYARHLLRLTSLIVPAWRALRRARREAAADEGVRGRPDLDEPAGRDE